VSGRIPSKKSRGEYEMPKSKSVTESGVPLYLLPRAIARHINRIGDPVYRISVKRTHWHHYNISVRTKSLPKELVSRVARLTAPGEKEPDHPPMIHVHLQGCAV
jgi:hypothetical protein